MSRLLASIADCAPRPTRYSGSAVGLLGGSFNPPHAGHRQISLTALRRLGLRQVWWLVSPGNPLKDHSELKPFAERRALAARISRHPRIAVSTFEHDRGLIYTAQTIAALRAAHRDLSFVWIMGADNLATFHHWERWRSIAETVPIAVFDRPGYRYKALSSPAATAYQSARIAECDALNLSTYRAPAWTFLTGPLNPLSSTQLRNSEKNAKSSQKNA